MILLLRAIKKPFHKELTLSDLRKAFLVQIYVGFSPRTSSFKV